MSQLRPDDRLAEDPPPLGGQADEVKTPLGPVMPFSTRSRALRCSVIGPPRHAIDGDGEHR